MAQLVEWNGRQVPPHVREALVTPWRGQENGQAEREDARAPQGR
eukprot:CAMPEP_0119266150 /NCGR_PEP_ID=MMETSP1329-20130426/4737_1 /TAXON_ID=114041 /ORGANISM="Genus nov. species nov., Strain RCC1024" /LENGTH=43 /DNA_ID= /DNA_START= /DNA_END= /DNA_ORIENTATION=